MAVGVRMRALILFREDLEELYLECIESMVWDELMKKLDYDEISGHDEIRAYLKDRGRFKDFALRYAEGFFKEWAKSELRGGVDVIVVLLGRGHWYTVYSDTEFYKMLEKEGYIRSLVDDAFEALLSAWKEYWGKKGR